MCVTKINGGEHAEFIGAIEQGGVFYAASESVIDPDACSTLDAAVPYAIEEIEKLINARFPNAAAAHNTIDVWKKNNSAGEWFTQYSTILNTEDAPAKKDEQKAESTEQEATKEPENKPATDEHSADAADDFGVNGKSVKEIESQEVVNEHEGTDGRDTTDNTASSDDTDRGGERAVNENSDDRNTCGDSERFDGDDSGAGVCGDPETVRANVVDLEQEVAELEKKWAENSSVENNMRIWSQVHRTDRTKTKKDHSGRTSISTQYRIQKMTEAFGPVGFGWGYRVIREWTTEGAPIFVNNESSGFNELIHHCEIELWCKIDGEKSEPITHYGDTRQFYYSRGWQDKPGYFVNDDEVHKKSLSDALGKAMSMLGVCADVYLGEHDDDHIATLNANVAESNKKVRHLEEEEKIRKEVNEKLSELVSEMKETTTKSGVNALRGKGLFIIDALPSINKEQQKYKSDVIGKFTTRYNERIKEIFEEQERKKKEKAEKDAAKAEQEKQTAAELEEMHRKDKAAAKTDSEGKEA